MSNITVGDVLDQGVVMMGCRVNRDHPEGSMKRTGALYSMRLSRAYRLTKSFSTAALCIQI